MFAQKVGLRLYWLFLAVLAAGFMFYLSGGVR